MIREKSEEWKERHNDMNIYFKVKLKFRLIFRVETFLWKLLIKRKWMNFLRNRMILVTIILATKVSEMLRPLIKKIPVSDEDY